MAGAYGMIPMADGGALTQLEQLLACGAGFPAPSLGSDCDSGDGCVSTCGIQCHSAGLAFAQLVSIGTVAQCPCHTGMWGNGPSSNCKTVPAALLVLAASLSFSTTSPVAAPLPLLSLLSRKNILEG